MSADGTTGAVPIETDAVIIGGRPGRAVRGVRARPRRHQGARHRHSRQAGRTVRRAIPGEADLRHSWHADRDGPGADRRAAWPRSSRSAPPSICGQRVDALQKMDDGRFRLVTDIGTSFRRQGRRDRGGRGIVHAKTTAARRYRGLRGQVGVLFGAADGRFPGQGRAGGRRRQLGPRLDAQSAAHRQEPHPAAPARRVPWCAAFGRADAGAGSPTRRSRC